MLKRDYEKISFHGVGLLFIVAGAFILAICSAAWFVKAAGSVTMISFPFFKAMASMVIIGIGYIILEIELLRKK